MAKGRAFWTINCQTHGSMTMRGDVTKWLKVAEPKNKREKNTVGCPFCKKLKKDKT